MKNRILLLSAFIFFFCKTNAQEAPAEDTTPFPAETGEPSVAGETDSIAAAKEIIVAAPEETEEEEELAAANNPAPEPLKLCFPDYPGWNVLKEGQKLEFVLKASGGTDSSFTYSLAQGKLDGMEFDSRGHFTWTPDHNLVGRLATDSVFQLLFKAVNSREESVSQVVDIKVEHVNRPPIVGELKPFYVRYNTSNSYTIEASAVKDEDNDPVVFIPVIETMPEGAKLTEKGEFTWRPSWKMFSDLANNPLKLEFYVEDQPSKARTKGHFIIKQTQQDLPPAILMTPSQTWFQYKEDATINLKFHLHDQNGEDDISSFSFISGNHDVPESALVKNTTTQYEFIWEPGYDFVKDPLDSLSFNITFFVLDKSNRKDERTVRFTIINAVNEVERDQKLYNEYRASLVRAWDLMEQLKEAEKDLKKKYKRAKRGKKARSLTNASLGAATGITPVVVQEPGTSKKITAIGGTAVMTIGTLEATEVFGRSSKDLVERLNYIIEKRNELQTKGDIFARKYALKSSRRKTSEFMKDVDEFVSIMNLKGMVALELDAAWQNKNKPTDRNIAKTYKDFSTDN